MRSVPANVYSIPWSRALWENIFHFMFIWGPCIAWGSMYSWANWPFCSRPGLHLTPCLNLRYRVFYTNSFAHTNPFIWDASPIYPQLSAVDLVTSCLFMIGQLQRNQWWLVHSYRRFVNYIQISKSSSNQLVHACTWANKLVECFRNTSIATTV